MHVKTCYTDLQSALLSFAFIYVLPAAGRFHNADYTIHLNHRVLFNAGGMHAVKFAWFCTFSSVLLISTMDKYMAHSHEFVCTNELSSQCTSDHIICEGNLEFRSSEKYAFSTNLPTMFVCLLRYRCIFIQFINAKQTHVNKAAVKLA